MERLKVNATFQEEVYIEPSEALAKIKEQLGFADDRHSFLCVRDGRLMRGEDVSYHGSPLYEYTLLSDNPKWVALYNSVKCLEDYYRHAAEPEWQKIQEPIADEDEAPVMQM